MSMIKLMVKRLLLSTELAAITFIRQPIGIFSEMIVAETAR